MGERQVLGAGASCFHLHKNVLMEARARRGAAKNAAIIVSPLGGAGGEGHNGTVARYTPAAIAYQPIH